MAQPDRIDRRTALTWLQCAGLVPLSSFGGFSSSLAIAALAADNPLQQELDELARSGGGVLSIRDGEVGDQLVIRGADIVIDGRGGTLFDTRIVIAAEARRITVRNLTLLDRSGRDDTWHLDVSGQDCTIENVKMVKAPIAAGYHAYFRAESRNCRMRNFTAEGSNGFFVAGGGHSFSDFTMSTPIRARIGGDDAFAIKGAGSHTHDIRIERGHVDGFAAAVSIGSEIGRSAGFPERGSVVGVTVSQLRATRCWRLVFIKPGALIYDWRDGIVRNIVLEDLSLSDPDGVRFGAGIVIVTGRGALVDGVLARGIRIRARTPGNLNQHTAAIDISTGSEGAPSSISDVDIQLAFDGAGSKGALIDHVAKIEKADPFRGSITEIRLDLAARETRYGGVYIGRGIDDGVELAKLELSRVALDPPASVGAAGVWSESQLRLGDIQMDLGQAKSFGGGGLVPAD